jgi:PAS domain-containing protein
VLAAGGRPAAAGRAGRGPRGGGHLVDISARKRAEAALLAREEALRRVVQHTQSILDNVVDAVITIDHQGRVQSFNQAATRSSVTPPRRRWATTCRC